MQPEDDEIHKRRQFMNKIDQISETVQSLAGSSINGTKNEKTDAFENALSKALYKTKTDKTEDLGPEDLKMEQTSTGALNEITSINLNIINSSDIVSGQTDKLLGLLDAYSSKLVDPNISLKNIAPVVEEINNNAGSLLKETQNLTDSDINLKHIATHTIVTAQTEYLKFHRGDYIS